MVDHWIGILLRMQKPLDICVPINSMHTKKEEPVIICKTLAGIYVYIYIFKLYYKFIWCKIVTNDKTLTGSVSICLVKTIFLLPSNSFSRHFSYSMSFIWEHGFNHRTQSSHPSTCLIPFPLTNKYFPKTRQTQDYPSTQKHTHTHRCTG